MISKQKMLLILVLALFTDYLLSLAEEQETPGNFKNPDAVKNVLSVKYTVANAAWWGFDKVDSTAALQGAIDSGARKVIVPYMGSDWIVRPIKLASNQEIYFEPGVVVTAKKGEFKGIRDYLFHASCKNNITLTGYGATLRMHKSDYMTSNYTKGSWRHVIALYGSSNVVIQGLTLRDSGGDGIYIGAGKDKKHQPCQNISIRDCIIDNNYRQGISVVSVSKLRVENCVFSNTIGTPPSAGIDLEPNTPKQILDNIVISNCISRNNAGPGFQIYLAQLSAKSEDISILFVDCYVSKCKSGLTVAAIKDIGPQGLVEFRNCTVEDVKYAGLYIHDLSTNRVNLRFNNCNWRNVSMSRYRAPLDVALKRETNTDKKDGIEFINCHVYDEKKRPFLKIRSIESSGSAYNIKGDINVHNPYGAKTDLGTPSKGLALKVNSFEMRR